MSFRASASPADKAARPLADRRLPFGTELCVVRGGGSSRQSHPALLAELSLQGAVVVLAGDREQPGPGEQIGLTVTAASCRLFDIAAEVTDLRFDPEGHCLAECEFRPALPRRQFLLLRRLALPGAVNSARDRRRRPESAA